MPGRIPSVGAGWLLITLAAVVPASAQARLSGVGAAGFGQDHVAPSVAVSLAYDVKPAIGFELEFAVLSGLSSPFDGPRILGDSLAPLIFPAPDFRTHTRIVSFSANLVGQLAKPESKMAPFVVVGGGTANVARRLDFPRFVPDLDAIGEFVDFGESVSFLLPYPISGEFTENAFMATVGGGIDVRITERWSAGVDVRYQHVFSDIEAFGMTRVGGRVSVKF